MSPERSAAIDRIRNVSPEEMLEGLHRNIRALEALERKTDDNALLLNALQIRVRELERKP